MLFSTAFLGLLVASVHAHPGEAEEKLSSRALAVKREHAAAAKRGLSACEDKASYRKMKARAANRRRGMAKRHAKRDLATIVGTDHEYNGTVAGIFDESPVCILQPEGEIGPFYVPGEYVRENLREGEEGVNIILDGQFIDVETCEPIVGLYWDIWNCNSTGVYGGVQSTLNLGNYDDASNLDNTMLRGIGLSDEEGVVQFQTIFPGHYDGRASHHHIVATLNATKLANGTIEGGYVAHVGQLFWDQSLIYEVEATAPYNTSDIDITLNEEDHVVIAQTGTDSDPFFNYFRLGDSIEDGLLGWVTVGINKSAIYDTATYSFQLTSEGGEAVDGGGFTMESAGGAPTGEGAAPSGAPAL